MPPKGKSKAQIFKQSFIGQFAANKTTLSKIEKKLIEQQELINSKKLEIETATLKCNELDQRLSELNSLIHTKEVNLSLKKEKLGCLSSAIAIQDSEIKTAKSKIDLAISKTVSRKRKLQPTTLDLPKKAKSIRTNETFNACKIIHGGNNDNLDPALNGIVLTMTTKFSSDSVAKKIMVAKPAVVKKITNICKSKIFYNYYTSQDNILRSLSIYYSHSVMGKRKYLNVRKANKKSVTIDKERPLPNYVSYKALAKAIQEIDIGTLKNVTELIGESTSSLQGMFRPCDEYAIELAKFYLFVNQKRKDKLKVFPALEKKVTDSVKFVIAIGGDGAPISGCLFLISFLNVGKRLMSSNENYLLFGANCEENSYVVRQYILKLVSDLKFLETNVFNVTVENVSFKVEFKLGELPNDMKMLAFLAGELSNSSYFFSTFGNVNQDDANNYKKKFCEDWKPFDYEKRLLDAHKVQKKKKELDAKNISHATKRTQLTTYISKTLHSRQEEIPLVDKYVMQAKAEPLHLKNNVVKELFIKLLKIVVSQSSLKNEKSYKNIPTTSLFVIFVNFIHKGMCCNFLSRKIITWYNDNSGKIEKDFTFRFRGQESRAYLSHFPELIKLLLKNITNEQIKLKLFQIFHHSLCLRKIISISVRIIDFNDEMLAELQKQCKLLFRSWCLFEPKVSPSVWTICNVVPFHAENCYRDYGMGLGCNSMEPREQKHQQIEKYARNTTFQCRWPMIFRHEFVQLIYLRRNGYDEISYNRKVISYMPQIEDTQCKVCGLELSNNKCFLCGSILMMKVQRSLNN